MVVAPTVATTSVGPWNLVCWADDRQATSSSATVTANPSTVSRFIGMEAPLLIVAYVLLVAEPLRHVGEDVCHDRDRRRASGHLGGIDLVHRVGRGVVNHEESRAVHLERERRDACEGDARRDVASFA